jgi:hypothetical protein
LFIAVAVILVVGAIVGVILVKRHLDANAPPDPTIPPQAPSRAWYGSLLPETVAGYSVLGGAPVEGQTQATYALDADRSVLIVMEFDPTGRFGPVGLEDDVWYGMSRCGMLWERDEPEAGISSQAACVTILQDGVLSTVGAGGQLPADVALVANAVYDTLD